MVGAIGTLLYGRDGTPLSFCYGKRTSDCGKADRLNRHGNGSRTDPNYLGSNHTIWKADT